MVGTYSNAFSDKKAINFRKGLIVLITNLIKSVFVYSPLSWSFASSCSAETQQLVPLGAESPLSEHLFGAAGDVMSPCSSRLLIKKPDFTSQRNLNRDPGAKVLA